MFSRLKCSTDVWDVSGVDVVVPSEFVSAMDFDDCGIELHEGWFDDADMSGMVELADVLGVADVLADLQAVVLAVEDIGRSS